MIDFAGTVAGLVVVVFTYWLLEERAKLKREEEAKARAVSEVQSAIDGFLAANAGLKVALDGFAAKAQAAMAYIHLEKRARFLVTISHLGARHELIFDGTEPSRLAVLDLALRRNPLMGRQ